MAHARITEKDLMVDGDLTGMLELYRATALVGHWLVENLTNPVMRPSVIGDADDAVRGVSEEVAEMAGVRSERVYLLGACVGTIWMVVVPHVSR